MNVKVDFTLCNSLDYMIDVGTVNTCTHSDTHQYADVSMNTESRYANTWRRAGKPVCEHWSLYTHIYPVQHCDQGQTPTCAASSGTVLCLDNREIQMKIACSIGDLY